MYSEPLAPALPATVNMFPLVSHTQRHILRPNHAGTKQAKVSMQSFLRGTKRLTYSPPEPGLGSPTCTKASPTCRHSLRKQSSSPSSYRPELVTRVDSRAERGNGRPRSERGCQAGLQAWAGAPPHWAPWPPTRSPLQLPPLAAEKKPHKS